MKDIMIDIETLGTRSTSAIIQIGACYFDRKTGEIGNEFCMNVEQCSGFTTDKETMDWWEKQSKEARESVFSNPQELEGVLHRLQDFLKKGKYLWSHATFDVPIIMNAMNVYSLKMPIHYRSMRDIRTLMDLAGHKSEIERTGIHHNALDDAKYQAQYCSEAIQKLLGKKHIGL